MAKKVQVEVDVTAPGLDETEGKFVKLTSQIRETKRQLQAAQESGDAVKFNSLKKQLDDLEDKLDVVNLKQREFHDALATMPGAAGKAGQALQGVETAFKSLIANPIVAIIAGVALVFTSVYEALKKTAEGQAALTQVTDAFSAIITPLIKFISAVAVPVVNLLAAGLNAVGQAYAWATGTSKEFNEQLADNKAAEEAEKNAKRIEKNLKEHGNLYDDITKKKLTASKDYLTRLAEINRSGDTEAEKRAQRELARQEQNKAIGDATKERAKNAADATIATLEGVEKVREAQLEKRKQEALTTAKTEQDKLNVEIKFAKLSYELKRGELEKTRSLYAKGTKDYNDANAELISLDANYIGQKIQFKEQQKKISEDNIKTAEDFATKIGAITTAAITDETAKAKAARSEKYRADVIALEKDKEFIKLSEESKAFYRDELKAAYDQDTQKIEDDATAKAHDKKLRALELEQQGLIEGSLSYFDNKEAILAENRQKELDDNQAQYNQKLISEEEFNKKKAAIEAKFDKQSKDLQKSRLDTYLGYVSKGLSGVSNVLSMASNVMKMQEDQDIKNAKGNTEKITEIKRKAFEENKKMQIAQAIIGTLQAAIQAYQSLAVIPVVGPALGAAAAAAALIFGYKQVSLISQQQFDSGDTGAASAGATSDQVATPSFNGTANVPAPQIGASSAQSSGNLGQVVGTALQENNSTTRPIQAYVIGDQVSTQQQLDRRISVAARMGG